MGKAAGRSRSREQRALRRRRDERAFQFEKGLSRLAEFERSSGITSVFGQPASHRGSAAA